MNKCVISMIQKAQSFAVCSASKLFFQNLGNDLARYSKYLKVSLKSILSSMHNVENMSVPKIEDRSFYAEASAGCLRNPLVQRFVLAVSAIKTSTIEKSHLAEVLCHDRFVAMSGHDLFSST